MSPNRAAQAQSRERSLNCLATLAQQHGGRLTWRNVLGGGKENVSPLRFTAKKKDGRTAEGTISWGPNTCAATLTSTRVDIETLAKDMNAKAGNELIHISG